MMYLHTLPALDHEACNITLNDVDYENVAAEFGAYVDRYIFADLALSRWSYNGGLELKTLEELEGRVERMLADPVDLTGNDDEVVLEESEVGEKDARMEGGRRSRRDSMFNGSEVGGDDMGDVDWTSVEERRRMASLFQDSSDEEMDIKDPRTNDIITDDTATGSIDMSEAKFDELVNIVKAGLSEDNEESSDDEHSSDKDDTSANDDDDDNDDMSIDSSSSPPTMNSNTP